MTDFARLTQYIEEDLKNITGKEESFCEGCRFAYNSILDMMKSIEEEQNQ